MVDSERSSGAFVGSAIPLRFCLSAGLLFCAATGASAQAAPVTPWNDTATGLSWTRPPDATSSDWANAKQSCTDLAATKSGWRLPTLSEVIAVWQGSHFKDGFPLGTGNMPVWTSDVQGSDIRVFVPRSSGGTLLTIPRRNKNVIPLCVRKRQFWELRK
jgi:hypothetical protein